MKDYPDIQSHFVLQSKYQQNLMLTNIIIIIMYNIRLHFIFALLDKHFLIFTTRILHHSGCVCVCFCLFVSHDIGAITSVRDLCFFFSYPQIAE